MNKLFSVLFIMTVFCYGADESINDSVALSRDESAEQVVGMDTVDVSSIKKGSCAIYLDATTATDEEKEAAYQAIESAISQFEGKVPDSIDINVGISNLELVESAAYDFDDANQETESDRVIAVKDIKLLEVVIDIVCDQATAEEKSEFFRMVSTVLVDLCSQLQEVANNIHGSITFDSPDLINPTRASEVVDEVQAVAVLSQVSEDEMNEVSAIDPIIG
jgi:hypothetical protein